MNLNKTRKSFISRNRNYILLISVFTLSLVLFLNSTAALNTFPFLKAQTDVEVYNLGIEIANNDPRVIDELGILGKVSRLAIIEGEVEYNADMNHIISTVRVEGKNAKAKLDLEATKVMGSWELISVKIRANGKSSKFPVIQVFPKIQISQSITYAEDAYKIFENETFLSGRDAILNYYRSNDNKIISENIILEVPAILDSTITYRISALKNLHGDQFKNLSIIKDKEVVLEFITKSADTEIDYNDIDNRRDKWMVHCNAHEVTKLVTNLYSTNSIYYNHKPVIVGHEPIINEYSYMNAPTYSLDLNPVLVEPVHNNLAFEIGVCKGSYRGNYILVWKKIDGIWKIIMDSNI